MLAAEAIKSTVATSKIDATWGSDAVFAPVHSCLSEVVIVVYVRSLPMLERMDAYRNMYGPYFAGIEFYVDGTWCDPRATPTGGKPCYGDHLDRFV